jgi:hypothetical protein
MPDGSWGYTDAMPLGRFRSASAAMKSPAAQRTAFGAVKPKPTRKVAPKRLTHVPVEAGDAGTILLSVASVLTAADVLDLAASIAEAAASIQQRAFEWESRRQGLPQLPGQEIMKQLASNDLVQPGGGAFKWGGVEGDATFGGLETDALEASVSGQDLRYASRARVGLDNDQKWAEGQGRWGDANENIKVGALLRRGD